MPSAEFTKLRYLNLIVGIVLFVVDIGSDIWVAVQFYNDGHYAWSSLTMVFVLTGSVVPQVFSCAWFIDDIDESERSFSGITRTQHIFLHILQLGLFIRYFQVLKKGRSVIPSKCRQDHLEIFGMTTDLSMLRLFEIFLESTPQLLLQLYIILGHNHRSIIQYLCIAGSFFSIAWTTVEYRRSFRRSLPRIKEMPSGLPTAVYLFYKLFTIVSRILSLSLLVVLSLYGTTALLFLWLCGTIWAHKLQTDFCTSRGLEWFYRGIVGVILIFTFFNVKGQNARVSMTVYYAMYTIQNLTVVVLFYSFKYLAATSRYFLPVTLVIAGSKVFGLTCLMMFYTFLHQKSNEGITDEVDGQARMWTGPESGMKNSEKRIKEFLQH